MPILTRTMQKILEGLAYADLAEMQPMDDKVRSLTGDAQRPNPPVSDTMNPVERVPTRRRIGLLIGPFVPRCVFDYAADSCERLGARLVVLTFLGEAEARALIDGFTRKANPLTHAVQIETLTGDPARALQRVLGRGIRLDFLVCDEQGYLGHHILGHGTVAELPVVLVATPRDPDRTRKLRATPPGGPLPAAC